MNDAATAAYLEAMNLFAAGDHAAAEQGYRKVLVLAPEWPDAMLGLATTLMHLGRLDEAIAVGRRITEIDKEDPFPHTSLSIFYQKKSALAEASGNKAEALELIAAAEKSGAQARLLSWKQELRTNPSAQRPDLPAGMDVIQ